MTLASIKMTARQFEQLGEDPPGVRLELVHGEILVSPSPAYEHHYTALKLSQLLLNHIDAHDLGELVGDVDTYFGDYNVRRPDLIFTAKARLHLLDERHGIRFPPDLCVEILSPGSATMDQTDKFELYAAFGVAHYWLVDPRNRTFVAYKLSRKKYVEAASGGRSDVVSAPPFPKLKIPLEQLWLKRRK